MTGSAERGAAELSDCPALRTRMLLTVTAVHTTERPWDPAVSSAETQALGPCAHKMLTVSPVCEPSPGSTALESADCTRLGCGL